MKKNFNIYSASAGSGKTFTLVKEYLKLLFTSSKKDHFKNILAITFTNKAVGEMKSRIIKSLSDFATTTGFEGENALLSAILKETSFSKEEIQQKASEILKSIIHDYAAFEISTIDGFTHRVLRTFAKDLGIPMNFEVELDTDLILAEAVDSLISRTGEDEELTKTLIEFTLTKADDDKSWDISRDLLQIARLLVNENHQNALAILKNKSIHDFRKFEKKITSDIKFTENQIREAADYFFDLLNQNSLQESDFSGQYLPKHFKKLQTGNGAPNFEARWTENITSGNLYPKKTSEIAKITIDQIQPEIAEIFNVSKQAYFQVEFLREIKKNLVQLSLLNEINQEVENIKKDRNFMLISEFNPRISQEVKNQPAPFIYERLGERYQHYFIDEFQDTSTLQWENLIPLIGNKLESAEKSSLTIVGDAKQSIYRWRGGKAEQFIDLSNRKSKPFQVDPNLINLPDNYRSGSVVVNFNNDFFRYASTNLTHPEYASLFENSYQNPKKGDFGYVNISFLEAKNRDEELELYPEKIREIILDLEKKGFSKSDICILTRKRKEGIAIANYLNKHEISVISSETLLVSNSPKVNFIIDILQFSLHPDDGNLKLKIVDYLSTSGQIEVNFHEVLQENLHLNDTEFFRWLLPFGMKFDLETLKDLSLYESCEYIIRSFELVEKSDAYIQFFMDFVYENTQKSSNALSTFLEKWEQKKNSLSIVVPAAENAIQIMTIHKSKGLEFPVVIYPFANSDLQDTRNDSLWINTHDENIPIAYVSASKKMLNWNSEASEKYLDLVHKNELDTLNVLYVACTRASQQLYILTNFHEKPKSAPNISDLLKEYLSASGNPGDLKYEFGDSESYRKTSKIKSMGVEPEKYFTSATENESIEFVTRSGALWDSAQQEAIEKGEIVHDILAKIEKASQLDDAMNWAYTSGIIKKDTKDNIATLIKKIITHPDLKAFYEEPYQVFNEKEILTHHGKRLRPDRVNIKGNMATIIDYKTGGLVEHHSRQVSEYAEALENMGYLIDKKILIYTNEAVLVKYV